MKIIKIKVKGTTYRVKDCKGLASIRGLMFDNIDRYDGAFIYANSIWMPFVKHSLNLFFLDANKKLISMQKAEPMTLNPKTWKTYSNKRAKYCLEVKCF